MASNVRSCNGKKGTVHPVPSRKILTCRLAWEWTGRTVPFFPRLEIWHTGCCRLGDAMRFIPLILVLLASRAVFAQGAPVLELTDFSGLWGELVHEDSYERSGGPPLGDYQGIPLNDAGRRKADSHDHSEWSLPEFQCRPHSAPYQWRALGSVRFWEEFDPVGRDLTAIHVEYLRSLDRVIYMDGRPHPPEYAPHSWSGFSTGKFLGNTLKVETTHIKASYLRRNGAAFSEKAKMTEFIDRHGDILTVTMILTD